MRILINLLALLTLVVLLVFPAYLGIEPLVAVLRSWPHAVWYHKRVFIEGLRVLQDREVRSQLPLDDSVPAWLVRRSQIAKRLKENPFVQDAGVESCGTLTWGCFVVTIQERRANLITMVGEEIWLVGSDGGFITPLPSKRGGSAGLSPSAYWRMAQVDLPIVSGVSADDASPDATRLRFRFVDRAIQEIEGHSSLEIDKVELRPNGELYVRFRKFDFPVIFDVPGDNFDRLGDEVSRLLALLPEFGGGLINRIESIDLAFDKVGVVKLKEAGS